jgi:ankyrin repeat protein
MTQRGTADTARRDPSVATPPAQAGQKPDPTKPGTQQGAPPAAGQEQKFDDKHPVTTLEGDPESKTLTIHDLNIFVAVRKRNYPIVQALLKSTPELVKQRNIKGATPLHLAAAMGDEKLVQMLIDAKASVNAKCNKNMLTGQTPLHLAAGQGRLKVMQILLNHEAAVDVRDSFGATPLHEAASHGQKAAAALLITNGARVNARQDEGYTPLFWAIVSGKADVVSLLIAKGANINVRTDDGLTPLLFAESFGSREAIVRLIKKAGGKAG